MAEQLTHESASVQSYLSILQGTITRMAANSASCKAWCITLVSAILVLIADKGKPDYVWISVVPIVLFVLLDAYYLGMEHRFREQYNEFIKKLHSQTATVEDIFILDPGGRSCCSSLSSLGSVSVWPFYGLLAAMLLIVRFFVINVS